MAKRTERGKILGEFERLGGIDTPEGRAYARANIPMYKNLEEPEQVPTQTAEQVVPKPTQPEVSVQPEQPTQPEQPRYAGVSSPFQPPVVQQPQPVRRELTSFERISVMKEEYEQYALADYHKWMLEAGAVFDPKTGKMDATKIEAPIVEEAYRRLRLNLIKVDNWHESMSRSFTQVKQSDRLTMQEKKALEGVILKKNTDPIYIPVRAEGLTVSGLKKQGPYADLIQGAIGGGGIEMAEQPSGGTVGIDISPLSSFNRLAEQGKQLEKTTPIRKEIAESDRINLVNNLNNLAGLTSQSVQTGTQRVPLGEGVGEFEDRPIFEAVRNPNAITTDELRSLKDLKDLDDKDRAALSYILVNRDPEQAKLLVAELKRRAVEIKQTEKK